MIKPIYKTIDNSPNDDRFRKHDERSQTKDTNTAKPNGNISLVKICLFFFYNYGSIASTLIFY